MGTRPGAARRVSNPLVQKLSSRKPVEAPPGSVSAPPREPVSSARAPDTAVTRSNEICARSNSICSGRDKGRSPCWRAAGEAALAPHLPMPPTLQSYTGGSRSSMDNAKQHERRSFLDVATRRSPHACSSSRLLSTVHRLAGFGDRSRNPTDRSHSSLRKQTEMGWQKGTPKTTRKGQLTGI